MIGLGPGCCCSDGGITMHICPCTGIPTTIYHHCNVVVRPFGSGAIPFPCTLTYQPVPADCQWTTDIYLKPGTGIWNQPGNYVFWSTQTSKDVIPFATFPLATSNPWRMVFGCTKRGRYFIGWCSLTPASPNGPTIQAEFFEYNIGAGSGADKNTCSPFSLRTRDLFADTFGWRCVVDTTP